MAGIGKVIRRQKSQTTQRSVELQIEFWDEGENKRFVSTPPTFNITPDLTRLILANSGRVYKDFKDWLSGDELKVDDLKT